MDRFDCPYRFIIHPTEEEVHEAQKFIFDSNA